MKNKFILIGSIVLVISIICVIMVVLSLNKSTFYLDNKEDNHVIVTVENASKGAGGIGYITIKENQKLEIKTDLNNKGSIKVEVLSSDNKDNKKAIINKKFKGTDINQYDLPSGNYIINITSEKGANGTMDISAR